MGPLPDVRCNDKKIIGPGVVSIGVGQEEKGENVASFGVNSFWYFWIILISVLVQFSARGKTSDTDVLSKGVPYRFPKEIKELKNYIFPQICTPHHRFSK